MGKQPHKPRFWGLGRSLHLTALIAVKHVMISEEGSFNSTAKLLKAVLAAQRFV